MTENQENTAMIRLAEIFRMARHEAAQTAGRDIRRDKRKLHMYCNEFAKKICKDEFPAIVHAALKSADGQDDKQSRLIRGICLSILSTK